ncbi:MAG: YbaN family protein [Bacteroidota bacterium]
MIARPAWVVLGFIFTGIGIIGYIVPLMPGLVFFILAAFCFAKGSRKFLRILLGNKFVGPAIMDWKRGRGMPVKSKIIALATVIPSMALSAYIVKLVWVRWAIAACAVMVIAIILLVKTKQPVNKKI